MGSNPNESQEEEAPAFIRFFFLSFVTALLLSSLPLIEEGETSARAASAIVIALAGMTTVAALRTYIRISLTSHPKGKADARTAHLTIITLGFLSFVSGLNLIGYHQSDFQLGLGQVLVLISGMITAAILQAAFKPYYRG